MKIMDWKTFIIELIKATVWPIAVAGIIFALRKWLAELIPRISKLQHKDTVIEFAKAVHELEKNASIALPENKPIEKVNEVKKFNYLMELAAVSPRSAVTEAWLHLELAASKAITAKHPGLGEQKMLPPRTIAKLLESVGLTKDDIRTYNELRSLRNRAVHYPEFEMDENTIGGYVDIALSLAKKINQISPNNTLHSTSRRDAAPVE